MRKSSICLSRLEAFWAWINSTKGKVLPSLASTRNFLKITFRGVQKFKKPANRAKLTYYEYFGTAETLDFLV
ncbi:hypothetical protein [Paenibacillus ferrarius]|uniref:hypothetical protein n=1 Tax=Paenibacillus ferrarius TaxID=1469647 RepID=UPI003D2930AC